MNKEQKDVYILGIESSCDETAAAVVKNGREVLSNIISSQIVIHRKFGGVVPEIASRKHIENIMPVIDEALSQAGVGMEQIDAVAVTYGPGLVGALLVGLSAAKALAWATDKPLIGVNHLEGHVFANFLADSELKPPFMALVVSGGHTALLKVTGYNSFELLGQTRDDAAGEALDKAGRTMGLAYPGGISIDKISKQGNENAFKFPHPRVTGSEYDFSFSGLKTSVINTVHNAKQKGEEINIPDLAASFQKSVVDCLIQNLEKAAIDKNFKKIVIAGGVSANSKLRREAEKLCQKHKWQLYLPELKYCGDNAAMIGVAAYYDFIHGQRDGLDLNAVPNLKLGER